MSENSAARYHFPLCAERHFGVVGGNGFGASPASIWRIKSAITPPSVPLPSLPPMTSVFGMNGALLFESASTAFTNAVAFAPKAATCLS
jgi:hypothetical protein